MLVFLCGLVGSGKTTLARYVAERFDAPLCSLDDEKKTFYPKDPDFERNMREGIPFGPETRMRTYHAAMERIAETARNHRHVIVEEALHTKVYREAFRSFAAAQGLKAVFIWITMEDAKAETLLAQGREGHMLSANAIAMRKAMDRERDGEEDTDMILHNTGSIDDARREIESFLLPHLA